MRKKYENPMMDFGLREVREVVDKLQCKGKLFIESNKGFRYAPMIFAGLFEI